MDMLKNGTRILHGVIYISTALWQCKQGLRI